MTATSTEQAADVDMTLEVACEAIEELPGGVMVPCHRQATVRVFVYCHAQCGHKSALNCLPCALDCDEEAVDLFCRGCGGDLSVITVVPLRSNA